MKAQDAKATRKRMREVSLSRLFVRFVVDVVQWCGVLVGVPLGMAVFLVFVLWNDNEKNNVSWWVIFSPLICSGALLWIGWLMAQMVHCLAPPEPRSLVSRFGDVDPPAAAPVGGESQTREDGRDWDLSLLEQMESNPAGRQWGELIRRIGGVREVGPFDRGEYIEEGCRCGRDGDEWASAMVAGDIYTPCGGYVRFCVCAPAIGVPRWVHVLFHMGCLTGFVVQIPLLAWKLENGGDVAWSLVLLPLFVVCALLFCFGTYSLVGSCRWRRARSLLCCLVLLLLSPVPLAACFVALHLDLGSSVFPLAVAFIPLFVGILCCCLPPATLVTVLVLSEPPEHRPADPPVALPQHNPNAKERLRILHPPSSGTAASEAGAGESPVALDPEAVAREARAIGHPDPPLFLSPSSSSLPCCRTHIAIPFVLFLISQVVLGALSICLLAAWAAHKVSLLAALLPLLLFALLATLAGLVLARKLCLLREAAGGIWSGLYTGANRAVATNNLTSLQAQV